VTAFLHYRDRSIRQKLMWTTVLAAGAALLLAVAGLGAYDLSSLRAMMVASLSSAAQITGLSSVSALLFEDRPAAEQTLGALRAEPHIVAAAIYTRNGRRFASYQREGATESFPEHIGLDQPERQWAEGGRLRLTRHLSLEKDVVGTIYLASDLKPLQDRMKQYAWIVLGVLSVSFVVAVGAAWRLQQTISRPILGLAHTAAMVSRDKNYAVRAQAAGRDEIGGLVEAFNDMLAQIQQRDRELEHRVEARTAELAAANKELEAFTYSVSHDLRAPLRHISGFSKILAESLGPKLDAESQRYLQRIQDGTRQMGLLVDDLLNLARLGRQEVRRQATGLNSLVDEVLRDLRPEAEGRNIEWQIGRLPFVDCDPVLMKQVLQNLLSNALKYSRTRERAVVQVDRIESNGEPVIFVRDNGVGFNMKYADRLFGVFQRLHRQEDFEGTGVGLATAQRILQKHGGRIWAEAELDKGATFYFSLAPQAVNPAMPPQSEVTNAASADRNPVGGR